MGRDTGISWTDHTFNPWWGCTKVSPGCDHCYAETFAARPIHKRDDGSKGPLQVWGPGAPRRTFDAKHWHDPFKWNREAEREGRRHLVFCASMADVMDDEAPASEREMLWKVINDTPHLAWQLLTKRPHRFERYLPAEFPHRNVWLMATAESQKFYDVRFPLLLESARRRGLLTGISYEPAIEPLSLATFDAAPDWIIFGGESGAGRRACSAAWAEALLRECRARRVAFFMKQMSAATPTAGKAAIPANLLVQEFPA